MMFVAVQFASCCSFHCYTNQTDKLLGTGSYSGLTLVAAMTMLSFSLCPLAVALMGRMVAHTLKSIKGSHSCSDGGETDTVYINTGFLNGRNAIL